MRLTWLIDVLMNFSKRLLTKKLMITILSLKVKNIKLKARKTNKLSMKSVITVKNTNGTNVLLEFT
jgi:hypothetical protein